MTSRPAPAHRSPTLDAAKGVAILLVVFFHVWGGLIGAGRLVESEWHTVLDAMVYTFHVPVFFFVSGVVLRDPLRQAGRLCHPYVLWGVGQSLVVAAMAEHANHPLAVADIVPALLIDPPHQFWFLHALIALLALVALADRLRLSPRTMLVGSLGLFVLTSLAPSPLVVRAIGRNAPYLAAGVWLGGAHAVSLALALTCAAFLGAGVAAGLHEVWWARPALGALGIAATLGLAATWPHRGLVALGQASLAIYLGHVLAAAPARWLPLPLVCGTVLGVGLPYALHVGAQRYGWPLFRLPAARATCHLLREAGLRCPAS